MNSDLLIAICRWNWGNGKWEMRNEKSEIGNEPRPLTFYFRLPTSEFRPQTSYLRLTSIMKSDLQIANCAVNSSG